ncbi:phosphatidylglycerol lysyltransferase domain-containing protein [Ottowia sp.]|uniref:phosphatidylglycerol lysyltransferase domain-containing protein n=1 Tax=Ottowia sp. TaxID=1898956 RepID=UPI003A85A709
MSALIRVLAEGAGERCLSEYAFANLWLFRREHRYRFHDGPWPWISGHTYDGAHHAMPLFAVDQAPVEVIDTLLARHDCLYPVPLERALRLDPARYRHTARRDDADYLYPADHFRHYRGALLNKKRNLMRQLLRDHVVQAQPYGHEWQTQALTVLAAWMHEKNQPTDGADELPCREALAEAQALGLTGFGYLVDGVPGGFVLAEVLQPGVYAMRFAKSLGGHKSLSGYKGLAQYMFHHFCVAHTDAQWLNFEQDLGLPNFRQTKQSYQPAALLEKCRVVARG